jgi:hypothetical protein
MIDFGVRRAETAGFIRVRAQGSDYLRTQLNKRIEARRLRGVKVSIVNDTCNLEKK